MTTETGMKQPAMGKIFRWGKYVCIVAIIEVPSIGLDLRLFMFLGTK